MPEMDKITNMLKEHYKKTFDAHGPTAEGVDWGVAEKAEIRYKMMLSVLNRESQNEKTVPSVLDVGCGYGGLYIYAKENNVRLKYTGIDVVQDMINSAKSTIDDAEFVCEDIFSLNNDLKFDYVVCNGILTQCLSGDAEEMRAHTIKLVKKMFSICNIGTAFNMTTNNVNFYKEGNFYTSPVESLAMALNVSNKVRLDHSYPLFEYTIYIYR